MNEQQKTLLIIAYLLQYPDWEWERSFDQWRSAVNELTEQQKKAALQDVFDYAASMEHQEYEEQYVRVFDFSKNTHLYLTAHDCTDPGTQASELLAYKELYVQSGYNVEHELPDYLPALLELCAQNDELTIKRILTVIKPKLTLLRERMIEARLMYVYLLDIILNIADELECA